MEWSCFCCCLFSFWGYLLGIQRPTTSVFSLLSSNYGPFLRIISSFTHTVVFTTVIYLVIGFIYYFTSYCYAFMCLRVDSIHFVSYCAAQCSRRFRTSAAFRWARTRARHVRHLSGTVVKVLNEKTGVADPWFEYALILPFPIVAVSYDS